MEAWLVVPHGKEVVQPSTDDENDMHEENCHDDHGDDDDDDDDDNDDDNDDDKDNDDNVDDFAGWPKHATP